MEKYKPTYPPMRPQAAVIAVALLAAAIVAFALFSCSARKRVATSTYDTDRTHTTTQSDTRQGSHRESASFADWWQTFVQESGRDLTLDISSTTTIPPKLDTAGRVIDPGSTTTTNAKLSVKDSIRTQGAAAARQDTQDTQDDSTRTAAAADTQADTQKGTEEKAVPAERTAMWTFFTVVALIGAGGFVWWRLKRKR